MTYKYLSNYSSKKEKANTEKQLCWAGGQTHKEEKEKAIIFSIFQTTDSSFFFSLK